MQRTLVIFLALLGSLMALPAFALELHQARASGMVGEKADGYVAAIQSTPEVKTLVDEVNARRQQEYTKISAQNGQPVSVVAKLAAQQIITKLEPGSMYQAPDGSWKKR